MDELTKLVSEKTGLPPEQARQAVQVVLDYLSARLPAPMASQLQAVLGGGGADLGDLAKNLGGLFGKK